jgi:methylglutaconyl-CoA hydratase
LNKPETIVLKQEGGVATISFNRPEVRNAMNLQMIREMSTTIQELNRDKGIRVVVYNSSGAHFCSGADLLWMQSGLSQSEDQLKGESLELAQLLRLIWESVAVTICSVSGPVPGGAIGLLAASDFVVAESSAVLTFSELKLGLVPATIAPYVMRKAGYSRCSDWVMTGRAIGAPEAKEAGLIHRICDEGSLEESTGILVEELLSKGPMALKGVKQMLRRIEGMKDPREVDNYTSGLIASFRISAEGQEGMKAFLEKRKPGWNERN